MIEGLVLPKCRVCRKHATANRSGECTLCIKGVLAFRRRHVPVMTTHHHADYMTSEFREELVKRQETRIHAEMAALNLPLGTSEWRELVCPVCGKKSRRNVGNQRSEAGYRCGGKCYAKAVGA